MLSHDLPKDKITQLISSGARTGSQGSHSYTKIKQASALATLFDYSVLSYMSWVILQPTEINSDWFSKKGSEWKDGS